MLVMLPSCLVKCAQSLGQLVLQRLASRRALLVMLPSCLVKCAQSLGQLVLQRLASRRALCPEIFPADARDAPLLPRQMRAVTRAVGFATPGVQEGPVSRNIPS